jgi:hypothetical protein
MQTYQIQRKDSGRVLLKHEAASASDMVGKWASVCMVSGFLPCDSNAVIDNSDGTFSIKPKKAAPFVVEVTRV